MTFEHICTMAPVHHILSKTKFLNFQSGSRIYNDFKIAI